MESVDKNGLTESEFLAAYKPGDYPRPSATADLALTRRDGSEILLIKRGNHPFIGKWALPGGFVNPDETVEAAAARELFEETGILCEAIKDNDETKDSTEIDSSSTNQVILLGVFSDPKRDPRGWTITSLFGAVVGDDTSANAGDDARDARWFKLSADDDGDILRLRLVCDELVLTTECRYELVTTPFGSEWRVCELSNDGLAFDHAKLISLAYLRYHQ